MVKGSHLYNSQNLTSVTKRLDKASGNEKLSDTTIKALKNIEKLAFPAGAVLFCCCGCGYSKEKTAEEMKQYLTSWPKMHGHPAGVKPK